MGRYILFFLITLLVVVLLFKVTYVKDRWLQPLLFAVPLLFFSRVPSEKLTPARFRGFLIVTAIAAVAVYSAFTIRVVGASYIDRFSRMSYPFSLMAQDIRAMGFEEGLFISNKRFLAGNMRIQFPGSSAIIPDYRFEKLPTTRGYEQGLVIWMGDISPSIPKELAQFLLDEYSVKASQHKVEYFEHLYKYGRTEKVKLAVMPIPLPKG